MARHPIFTAAANGDSAAVARYVDADSQLLYTHDEDGCSLLSYTVDKGHVHLVRLLLERGLNVNGKDGDETTALHLACAWDHRDVICALLEYGASLSIQESHGRNALMIASAEGRAEVVQMLLRYNAVQLGGGGLQIDAVDYWEQTALWLAACEGHAGCVGAMLEAGADPTCTDDSGQSPLHVTLEYGQDECTRLLEEWDRSYFLHRNRRLHDDTAAIHIQTTFASKADPTSANRTFPPRNITSQSHYTSCDNTHEGFSLRERCADVAPEYLKGRVGAGKALPRVRGVVMTMTADAVQQQQQQREQRDREEEQHARRAGNNERANRHGFKFLEWLKGASGSNSCMQPQNYQRIPSGRCTEKATHTAVSAMCVVSFVVAELKPELFAELSVMMDGACDVHDVDMQG